MEPLNPAQYSLRIRYASLSYANGPYDEVGDEERALGRGAQRIYLELHRGGEFRRLGNRPVTANLQRHATGYETTGDEKHRVCGSLNIGVIPGLEELAENAQPYAEFVGFLAGGEFDSLASALVTGGRELLSRATLHVVTNTHREDINYNAEDATYLITSLAVSFEIGDAYDEFADPEEE